jgi:hypothetical protein
MSELVVFDYGQLDVETRIVVRQRTDEIKTLVRRSAQDIIDIGNKLIDVKAMLGHGEFGPWLEGEFGWAERTAQTFMQVAHYFKSANFADLKIGASALYLLAAPSTPEPARIEAIQRAEAGEAITHSTAKAIVAQHKPTPPPAAPTPPRREYESAVPLITPPATVLDRSLSAMDQEAAALIEPEPRRAATPAIIAEPDPEPEAEPEAEAEDSDEWYTPEYIIEPARIVLGKIDLDPASCKEAQTVIRATTSLWKAHNSLSPRYPWLGRVWLNPPYSGPLPWVEKLLAEYGNGNTKAALLLVNTTNSPQWARLLWQSEHRVCLLGKRIKFWRPDRPEGKGFDRDQMIWYVGPNPQKFADVFSEWGSIR